MQTFSQVCTQYVKDELTGQPQGLFHDNGNGGGGKHNETSLPRIILIAAFYETIDTVKHNLSAVGVEVQKYTDSSSLLIIDAFSYYYPDISGMKKLVASL